MVVVEVLGLEHPHVQETHVRGVDVALQRLQPVALPLQAPDLVAGDQVGLDVGQGRGRFLLPAHVHPHQAVAFGRAIGLGMHLVLEFLARRHVGHVHAVPSHVELPAVVDAADAAFLVAAQVERGAAMRAAVVEDADASLRVAKGDELLAQQHQPHGIAVRLQLGGERRGYPVLPHELSHDGSGTHPRQVGAVLRFHECPCRGACRDGW